MMSVAKKIPLPFAAKSVVSRPEASLRVTSKERTPVNVLLAPGPHAVLQSTPYSKLPKPAALRPLLRTTKPGVRFVMSISGLPPMSNSRALLDPV